MESKAIDLACITSISRSFCDFSSFELIRGEDICYGGVILKSGMLFSAESID